MPELGLLVGLQGLSLTCELFALREVQDIEVWLLEKSGHITFRTQHTNVTTKRRVQMKIMRLVKLFRRGSGDCTRVSPVRFMHPVRSSSVRFSSAAKADTSPDKGHEATNHKRYNDKERSHTSVLKCAKSSEPKLRNATPPQTT